MLKREHGKGWSVRDHRGRVQLTRIFEDRSRSAVYLPLTWSADNATAILNTVAAIHDLMDSRKVSLKEAARLNTQALAEPSKSAKKVADKGWDAVAADFLKSRGDRRSSTLRDLKLRVERAVALINQKPKPRDGMSVLEAYAAAYFKEMAPGGQGRKRNLNDVVAFLQFAVDRCGAPDRFLPPPKDRIIELIGISPTSTTEKLTPPIKADKFGSTNSTERLSGTSKVMLWECLAITLDSEGKRYQTFLENNSHLQIETFQGINGSNLSTEEIIREGLVTNELALSPLLEYGAIGCAASHKAIWEKAAKGGKGYFVLEDDCYTHPLITNFIN